MTLTVDYIAEMVLIEISRLQREAFVKARGKKGKKK